MFNINEFNKKECEQSHSFIFFEEGPPYCMLGWEKYRIFNNLIDEILKNFKKEFSIEIYLYEHEVIEIEATFLWGFSFYEIDPNKRDKLSQLLKNTLYKVIDNFSILKNKRILNNHDEDFNLYFEPQLMKVYVDLVMQFELEINNKYNPPKSKSYEKDNFDLAVFNEEIKIFEFKDAIKKYLSMSSADDLLYRIATDGYFSNKYRSNKYLREEFIPLLYFIENRKISNDACIKLGIQEERYDAKIIDNEKETIIEITLGAPKNDYLYQTITQNNGISVLPIKVLAHLKKENDSLAEQIIISINKKHKKNYNDNRLLIVVIQPEYTYQNESYMIHEILKEVKNSVDKGEFSEIVLLFDSKSYVLW